MPMTKTQKRATGGSAAERGLDFQARVSAVVVASLLAERPLGWLEGVLVDVPVELDAETGGPGDDVRFRTLEGKRIELQAKRGLQRGDNLWEALLALARGLHDGHIDAGILAICPNSSSTIKGHLTDDIIRLGTGRSDGLHEIGEDFSKRLAAASLDVRSICSRIRIVVVAAVDGNNESEATATERLSRLYEDPSRAWSSLVVYGRELIRIRGKGSAEHIYRRLSLASVALKAGPVETRAQLQAAVRAWTRETYSRMTILGVNGTIPFDDCWLSLDAHVRDGGVTADEELDKAIKRYHDYTFQRRKSDQTFQSYTIGRFIKRCVVLGGPGIGKSTLLRKLALDYSRDGYLTLLVKLPIVIALLTRHGRRFEDCLLEVALSGSGLRPSNISLEGIVLLCDGMDECGSQQPRISEALHSFSVAHPNARIVVASRPIGFRPGELSTWRTYELHPLEESDAEKAISRILQAIPFPSDEARVKAVALSKDHLKRGGMKSAASRSPLMLSLVAALSAKGIASGSGKAVLYRHLFELIEAHPPARLVEQPPKEPERSRFLQLLGWSLLSHGNEPAALTLRRCSQWWSSETGAPALVSEAKVQACFEYWECLGVVERVMTVSEGAITFVHKTFGEFAAARYMVECSTVDRRTHIARAIQTPEWKEALSFASHLGEASLILEVWADLANTGDSNAGYGLDDATELIVQSGVPINDGALTAFAASCWRVLANSTSRTRYAAGEALCLVSKEHWPIVRADVLQRLRDADKWVRLTCWACASVSPEGDLALSEFLAVLRGLADLTPHPGLGRFSLRARTDAPVRHHLILGTAARVLQSGPDPDGLEVLKLLLADINLLSMSALAEITSLYKSAGLEVPVKLGGVWEQWASFLPTTEQSRGHDVYLLDVIDDPLLVVEEEQSDDVVEFWELGALITATNLMNMPAGEILGVSLDAGAVEFRRIVMHGVARAAGLDVRNLVRQARSLRRRIAGGEAMDLMMLFRLPRVDVEADFECPSVTVHEIDALESGILGGGSLFPWNSGQLLCGLRDEPEFEPAIRRLLTKGKGGSLRVIGALVECLPESAGQQLLLTKLGGELTPGCKHLYERLKPPFDAGHVEVICGALEETACSRRFSRMLPCPRCLMRVCAHASV